MKVSKALLSLLLTLCLLATPFSGIFVSATSATAPIISFNIDALAYVTPDQTISVTYAPQGDATLVECNTTLEGISLGTAESVSFTPEEKELAYGRYTLVATATDSNGVTAIETLAFEVVESVDIKFFYDENENIVPYDPNATAAVHEVEMLDFTMSYGSTTDGSVDLADAIAYGDDVPHNVKYLNIPAELNSATGIPYQLFDIALNGKTDGEVAVRYTGATYAGERIALRVYNPTTSSWDTLVTFLGADSVSASVDVATYGVEDKIHVMAILDYVTNGSDTMIWSTDPQHYTKFADLNAYYYRVYEYAAELYEAGEAGYIITTGDLVDDRPSASVAAAQWDVADRAMQYVEAVGMPNGLVSGNHDVGDFKKPDYTESASTTDYSKYLEHFPASRYNSERWYGGSLNNNISHYDLITIGNVDFIILYLGYGLEATDETIVWANDVLQTYSHRTAIVATHQYLDAGAAVRDDTSRAQLIFDEIIDPNPNVKAVICGHDDGSLCLEKTASDGRTVYEILSDYQFVEAEAPEFYENEHYIGNVGGCCGDGYIRLLTVKGETLSSITYSPVTGRYNPYGDRENIAIDLDCGPADRSLTTIAFSAYVVGEETTEAFPTTDTAVVVTKTVEEEEPVNPEEPVEVKYPATPSEPYTQHAADYAPNVETKIDLLNKIGVSNNHVVTGWQSYGSMTLNVNIDLTKTPYLYYSVSQPEESNFTFALYNNSNYAPWLFFRDATGEGAYMNSGAPNWDAYTNREQYTTTSETGCIDLRTYSTDPNKATWIINQINFYNSLGKEVVVNYMFVGSEPIEEDAPAPTATGFVTYHHVSYVNYPEAPEATVAAPVDLANYVALKDYAATLDLTPYTEDTAAAVTEALAAELPENPTNEDVQAAYTTLINAIGELKVYVEPIDETNLVSMHNYDMDIAKWYNQDANVPIGNYASHISATVTENGGLHMARSEASTNTWPSAIYKGASSITLKPNNGKIYVKLNVVANSAWCIYLDTTQGNSSAAVRLNFAIDNAFNRTDTDGYQGTYQGVYDVTEAFTANGFDPSATLKINRSIVYIVPGDVTYDYIELLTDPAAEAVDKTVLQGLVDEAAALTEAEYTTATWSKLSKAVTSAQTQLDNADAVQADVNLEVLKMRTALDQLKKLEDVIKEPENSLLPADEGLWKENATGTMNIYRDENKYTVLQNTNSQWPYADYTLPTPYETTVADHSISVDITVGEKTHPYLMINNTWVSMSKYISAANTNADNDLAAGTYTVDIPLSSITEIAGAETASISVVRVYAIGAAENSAVTIRKLMVTDYVAPPYVESERLDLIPDTTEEVTVVSGDGTATIENGVLTVVNNSETEDLRVTFTNTDLFNLETLNALHMVIDSEPTFKMAYQIMDSAGAASAWPNTSGSQYSHLFTVTDDRAAAGKYDVYLEISDNCGSIADKSAAFYNQFIILLSGKGTFTLSTAEMVNHDTFVWPESVTYGDPATPDNPYAEHVAKEGPEVETKVDLMPYFNSGLHPTVSSTIQTASGINVELDLEKTPYLYYSFIVPEGGDFTFSIYSNSTYSPWLSYMDAAAGNAVLGQSAASWDAATAAGRTQYATVSQTGCIDLRNYLKTDQLKWIMTQLKFYQSKSGAATVSYFFVGSAPIAEEPEVLVGDISGDGKINIADAMQLFASVSGKRTLTEEQLKAADYDGNGKVNIADAMKLFAKVSGR